MRPSPDGGRKSHECSNPKRCRHTYDVPDDVCATVGAEETRDAPGDAGMAAVDKALNASEEFRRTLPAAAPLEAADGKRRWRDKPFDGDIAARHLRERPSLDPVAVPMPPMPPMPTVGILARVAGAVGLAALAAFFMVGTAPLSLAVKADGEAVPASFWSRFAAQSSNPRQAPQEFKLASADGERARRARRAVCRSRSSA